MSNMSPTAQEALDKLLALKQLTRETHVQTYKTQRTILQSLNEQDLTNVSLALSREGFFAALRGER
jgi:hypothetical protein